MLVVTRKEGESIVIGDSIVVSVSSIRGNRVRLAIEAPRNVGIGRSESGPRHADRVQQVDRAPLEDLSIPDEPLASFECTWDEEAECTGSVH